MMSRGLLVCLLVLVSTNWCCGSEFLSKLLSDMDLTLPNIDFQLEILGGKPINCSIQLRCSEVAIGSLSMSTKAESPFSRRVVAMETGFREIETDCTGVLFYESTDRLIGSGKIGLEVFSSHNSFEGKWSFQWRRSKDREDEIPRSVRLDHCKTRVKYTSESFRVIGGQKVLSFIDQEVLNALAPAFGPLVVDPLMCMSLRLINHGLNTMLTFARWNMDWFFNHELPHHPKSIRKLEEQVRPRTETFGPKDFVVKLDNPVVKMVSDFVDTMLDSESIEEKGLLAINQIVRKHLLSDGPGSDWIIMESEKLSLLQLSVLGAKLGLSISGLRIRGLDSFEEIKIADIAGLYTIRNALSFSSPVEIFVDMILHEQPEIDRETTTTERESLGIDEGISAPFSIHLGAKDVDIAFAMLFGLDFEGFANMTLGNILHDPGCLASMIARISIPEMTLSKDMGFLPEDKKPIIKGEDELFAFVEGFLRLGLDIIIRPLYGKFTEHSSTFMQVMFEDFVNPLIRKLYECPRKSWPSSSTTSKNIFDFKDSLLMKVVHFILNDIVGTKGDLSLNRVLDWGLLFVLGDEYWKDGKLTYNKNLPTIGPIDLGILFPSFHPSATISVILGNISLSGVTSFVEFDMLDPISAHELANRIKLDRIELASDMIMDITGLKLTGELIHDEVSLAVDVSPNVTTMVELLVNILLEIDMDAVGSFQVRDLISLCIAYIFRSPPKGKSEFRFVKPPIGLGALNFSSGGLHLIASCRSCTSPTLPDILDYMSTEASWRELDNFINMFIPIADAILTNTSDLNLFDGLSMDYATNNLLSFLREECEDDAVPSGFLPRQQNSYKKPWFIPNGKVLMAVAAAMMVAMFILTLLCAKRRSSLLRNAQSHRLATTLLQTDYLNTGGSSRSSTGSASNHQNVIFTPTPPLGSDDSISMDGRSSPPVELDPMSEVVRRFDMDTDGATTEGDSGAQESTFLLREDGEEEQGLASRSTFSSSSLPLVPPQSGGASTGGASTGGGKNFHREVVLQFRRRVSVCSESRNSLLQSPRTVLSETDTLYLLGRDKAMFVHPAIGKARGILICVLLVVNFALFVSGNFFTMGRVIIAMQAAGDECKEIPMLRLTLDYCIDLLAQSGALMLFVVVGFCSGVLPWIRVALLMYAWVVPANVLPVQARGYLLRLMESAGKWIMTMFYFIVVLAASLNVTIAIPDQYMTFMPQDAVVGFVQFVPMWGLISFFIAALVSVVLNHLIIYYHDTIVAADNQAMQVDNPSGLANFRAVPDMVLDERDDEDSDFSLEGHDTENCDSMFKAKLVHYGKLLVGFGICLWPVLFAWTFFRNVYEFKFMGFAGFGVDMFASDGGRVRSQSVTSLLVALWNSDPADKTNILVIILMTFVYFLLIIVAPALGIIVGFILWYAPMKKRLAHRMLFVFRILNAWNCTTVLVVTFWVISMEMGKFFDAVAEGLSFCPLFLGTLLNSMGASDAESVCFGVEANLKEGWFDLLVFIIYSFLISRIIFYLVADAMDHKFDRMSVFLM